jgi:hypothetical protein
VKLFNLANSRASKLLEEARALAAGRGRAKTPVDMGKRKKHAANEPN